MQRVMAQITVAKTSEDLNGILKLQTANLRITGVNQEAGYVTATHDRTLLLKMNTPYAHSILKEKEQVVGYALVMLPEMRNEIEVLIPMFDLIDTCEYGGEIVNRFKYFVMGQICIASSHRAQGYFSKLYDHLISRLKISYDYIITEVDDNNKRSLGAHLHYGFEVLMEYESNGIEWVLLIKKIS